ncbi:MAG: PKD repeat protein [Cyclobacteriaceae bacterium]|jgi:PKD repeat protein
MSKSNRNKIVFVSGITVLLICTAFLGFQLIKVVNEPPLIEFDYQQTVKVGQEVEFKNSSIGVPDGSSWRWEFGDHTVIEDSEDATHAFHTNGKFTVKLTVVMEGVERSKTALILVTAPLPKSDFTIDSESLVAGKDIEINNRSVNAMESIWKLSDGRSLSGSSPKFQFNRAGSYDITLLSINDFGQVDELSKNVVVVGSNGSSASLQLQDEIIIKHIPVFDERTLSEALTSLANNELARTQKRKIRNEILKDVSSLKIKINEITLENYLNKIQLEASGRRVDIVVSGIARNNNNKISEISIN